MSEPTFGRNENLALNSKTFQKVAGLKSKSKMSVRGAVNKTAILLAIVVVSAAWSWLSFFREGGLIGLIGWLGIASIAAFIVGLITTAYMKLSPYTAPLYAFLEGSVLGVISAIFDADYPGIAIQAVLLTFGVLFGLLVVYRMSGFRVTAKFRAGVASATLAILLVYLINIVLQLVGVGSIPFIHQGGLIGIGLSLMIVFIAALNLVLDFDLIESGAREGAPIFMEWYSAFGLMVTLIWIYLEVLRLLAILYASSDDN